VHVGVTERFDTVTSSMPAASGLLANEWRRFVIADLTDPGPSQCGQKALLQQCRRLHWLTGRRWTHKILRPSLGIAISNAGASPRMHMQRWSSTAPGLLIVLLTSTQCLAQDTPKVTEPTVATRPAAPMRKKLDLRPPKITEVLSQETIERALRQARDPRTIEEVEVEGRREPSPPRTPDIPGGPFAVYWALTHPSQSWRILAPMAPDQAEKFNGPPPGATDPYRPPVPPPR
jgi:hypothetical protein